MASKYNLNDNVNESFAFNVGGLEWTMLYPLTEELEEIEDMYIKIKEFSEEKRKEEAQEVADKLNDKLYGLISPVEHDNNIREVMKKQNVRVLRNFNKMVAAELAIQ